MLYVVDCVVYWCVEVWCEYWVWYVVCYCFLQEVYVGVG